jgi:voltage-gated potassium channel
MNAPNAQEPQLRIYQLFMLALSALVLLAIAVESSVSLSYNTRAILQYADTAVCAIFFADFVGHIAFSRDRLGYLKWGWLDLLSSVPMIDALRFGRLARVVRIIRVLRAVRSTRAIASFVLRRRAQGAFAAVSLMGLLLVVFSSIAILQVEHATNANIKTPEDALWWSITTITTVGYGDRYPVTPEGRIVASVVMLCGVGIIGTCSGLVASWFLTPADSAMESELAAIHGELESLRKAMAAGQNTK